MDLEAILARLAAELQAATGLEVYVDVDRTPITESVIPPRYDEGSQGLAEDATEKGPEDDHSGR